MHRAIIFLIIFEVNEIFKTIFPKGSVLDTNILLISISFIKIGLLY